MSEQFYNLYEEYQMKFFQLPKVFFTNPLYKELSNDSKLAYAILHDRLQLSIKNQWVDQAGDIYFIYSNANLCKILNVSDRTVTKIRKARLSLALFGLEVSRAFQFWIFISDTMKACIIHRKHFSPTLFATKPWGIRRISHIHHIKLFNNFFRYVFRYFTAPTNEFDVPVLVFLFRVRSS